MWALPTRSRPSNCQRFIDAWNNTQAATPVYVRLDECDPYLEELLSLKWPDSFKIVVGKRMGLSAAMQETFIENPNEQWYGLLADDLVPRTRNWDRKIIMLAGDKNISYPNDLTTSRKGLPTHPVVAGDLVRELGWFGFPATRHYYVDTIWQFLGNNLNNLIYGKDIIVEHMHPIRDKAEKDIIYSESGNYKTPDTLSYNKWIEEEGPKVIERLKNKGFYYA